MTPEESIKRTNEAIVAIKGEVAKDAIKGIEQPPLVNMKTGETTGYAVEMQVSTKYDYSEELLAEWKARLGADSWNIRVRQNKLFLRFFVHYGKEDKSV